MLIDLYSYAVDYSLAEIGKRVVLRGSENRVTRVNEYGGYHHEEEHADVSVHEDVVDQDFHQGGVRLRPVMNNEMNKARAV